jgi:hypothetical protein
MRFSEQNELYGGPTRGLQNKIGHNGLYPSEYRAFPFPVYANQPQKRLAFAGSQLEVFDKLQSRLVVETGQEGQAAPRLCNLVAQSPGDAERGIQAGDREGTNGKGNGTLGDQLLQTVSEPDSRH